MKSKFNARVLSLILTAAIITTMLPSNMVFAIGDSTNQPMVSAVQNDAEQNEENKQESPPVETPPEMYSEPRTTVYGDVCGSITENAVWGDVTLNGDTTLSSDVIITLAGTVTVTGDVTLNGGTLKRDSENKKTLFAVGIAHKSGADVVVDAVGNLTMENVTLDGGGTESSGTWSGDGGDSILKVNKDSFLTLSGGAVVQNHVMPPMSLAGPFDSGAAVHIYAGGTLTMNDGSLLQNGRNEAAAWGAGISNWGDFTMNGGRISGFEVANTYTTQNADGTNTRMILGGDGGGVFNAGVFVMKGGEISDNSAVEFGGGVANYAAGKKGTVTTFTMYDGAKIMGNTVTASTDTTLGNVGGGGVYTSKDALFTMCGGEISGNSAPASAYGVYGGGGLFLNGGTFIMEGGTISGNTTSQYGGGVLVYTYKAKAEIKGGTISGNSAEKSGGGVYHHSGTSVLTGGTISENEATMNGGGIYALNGTLTLNPEGDGNLLISKNTAVFGGGLCADGTTITMGGGTFSENKATRGGGAAVLDGTYTINGGKISQNEATEGGGVYHIKGYSSASAFILNGGSISQNTATFSGGGLYVYSGVATLGGGIISDNNAQTAGKNVYAAVSCLVGGGLQVSNGLYLATGTHLGVLNALTDTAPLGVVLQSPPTSDGIDNGVLTAQAESTYSNGNLTETDLAHFTYDGDSCALQLKSADSKIYAVRSATRPNVIIDYEEEMLTNLPGSGKYTINGTEYDGGTATSMAIDSGWFDMTLTIIQKGSGSTVDSKPQLLLVHARPTAPTLTVTHASRLSWKDGKLGISGVAEGLSLECSTDGGSAWISVPHNISQGSYQVRIKASNTNENFHSPAATATVCAYPYAAVNTPLEITSTTAKLSGGVTKGTGEFSAALRYRAVGTETWTDAATEASGVSDKTFAPTQISGLTSDKEYEVRVTAMDGANNLSHEARIRFRTAPASNPPSGSIEADVTGTRDRAVTVSVRWGDTVLASASGTVDSGQPFKAKFTNLPNGVYSVVCESLNFIETRSVTIQNGSSSENPKFAIPAGNTNTVVKREGDDTPPVAAQGIPTLITSNDKNAATSGSDIEYALTVKKEDDIGATGANDLKMLAKEQGKTESLYYLDITLAKTTVDNSGAVSKETITDATNILEIAFSIPTELNGKKNILAVRYHDSSATAMSAFSSRQASPAAEGFYVDTAMEYIFLYAKSFSTYALAYEEPGGGGGSSGGGSARYTLTYESNGGTVYTSEHYAYGTTVRLDKIPEREGFAFTGWYADKTLNTEITEIKMTAGKTVYAGWQRSNVPTVPEMLNGDDHFAYVSGYADGTVRPLNNITRAEVAMLFYRLLNEETRTKHQADSNPFTDVAAPMWYNTAISTMAKIGVVCGRSVDTFDSDAAITRAEFAVICSRFDDGVAEGSATYTDITGHWAQSGIERAVTRGWIQGYTDGTFRPDNYIIRAEAIAMINRMLCRIPETEEDLLEGRIQWSDNTPKEWYYLAVEEATNSHGYKWNADGIHESWTKLQTDHR